MILATVVDVRGSSYRLPGARMLIVEDGAQFGTISGGCLEADVVERAKNVLKTGAAEVVTYDTRTSEDSVFALNMGCNGVTRILLEIAAPQNKFFQAVEIALTEREKQCVATLIATDDENVAVGGRAFWSRGERFDAESLSNFLIDSTALVTDCENFEMSDAKAALKNYQIGDRVYEFLFENIAPPLNLFVFGAGHDAIPLADIAHEIGWRAIIVDHRAAFATPERFPNAAEIFVLRPENYAGKILIDENSVAVIMTHNFEFDRQILPFLIRSNAVYVGALGPKKRMASLLAALAETKETLFPRDLTKLHSPVGLDIGADSPEKIALAIAAEIQSVLANRDGGFLRNRIGSIYERANLS